MTSSDRKCKVIIVPCSGIGKPFGTVSREAAYDLCEELRPGSIDENQTLCRQSKLPIQDRDLARVG